ncbi:TetR family transcriptional regulator [Subtercola endophyticus]|uniref:TetR family transcriptional regulator n=1 Tax=Subtercola endophyticus TaxID=2895559 RepID=UPI001E31C6A2|nr:TetR family transcriptional regulator [Subtercola endophyticus]UFS59385.1 TetR family transcriptional regulator [Subtercola endophyticus]
MTQTDLDRAAERLRTEARSRRAPAMALEDRRASIIAAVTPLLIEHGRQVTSAQIAAAAGIAEGTIFRAFGDKETLIDAAIAAHLDPEPFRGDMRAIDRTLPLEAKVHRLIELMRKRFVTVFQMMNSLGLAGQRPQHSAQSDFVRRIADLLDGEEGQLRFSADRIAQLIRMVALSASLPHVIGDSPIDNDTLTEFVLHGITTNPPTATRSTRGDAIVSGLREDKREEITKEGTE